MKNNALNNKLKSVTSACPHCGSGGNGVTVGLTWDFSSHCWRCMICGYRGYERSRGPRAKARRPTPNLKGMIVTPGP